VRLLIRRAAGGLAVVALLAACGPGPEPDRGDPGVAAGPPGASAPASPVPAEALAPAAAATPAADPARAVEDAGPAGSDRARPCVEAQVSVILRAAVLPAAGVGPSGEEELRRRSAEVVATMGDLLDPATIQISPAIRAFRVEAASEEAAEAVAMMLGEDPRVEAVEVDRCDATAPPR
jgi:hypothetical protein